MGNQGRGTSLFVSRGTWIISGPTGFEGLIITALNNGETLLTGLVDQAALYGLLKKVRDLGVPLLSIMHIETEKE